MKKTKMEKGITLIALMITIVVLLILAVVAINAITKDDILGRAEDATKKYNQAVENEQKEMEKYDNILNDVINDNYSGSNGSEGDSTQTVTEVKNKVISTASNTEVVDAYGNKIVVPAGFKIVVNADTNNADTVTKGIVIEDCTEAETKGSQFVWIPVGTIYTDTERTEANAETITLGRYVFDSNGNIDTSLSKTNPSDELKTDSTTSYSYTEGLKDSTTSNAHARDIEAFVTSATRKGGYYIGRYEARADNTTVRTSSSGTTSKVTSIKTNAVYNYVTQAQASSLAQGMYADGYSSGTFSSDLINSYAWDTAIVFLQEFDNRPEEKKTTPYSRQNSLNTSFSSTGTTEDVICNVYDMASNCYEWSTETYSSSYLPCVSRGGRCIDSSWYFAIDRNNSFSTTYSNIDPAFRPLLYVGL